MIHFSGEISDDIIYYRSMAKIRLARRVMLLVPIMTVLLYWFTMFEEPIDFGYFAMCAALLPLLLVQAIFVRPERKNPFTDYTVSVRILQDRIEMNSIELSYVRQHKDIGKVIDYGSWYCLKIKDIYNQKSIVCQKDLLIQGTLEEFENIFARKIVRRKMK